MATTTAAAVTRCLLVGTLLLMLVAASSQAEELVNTVRYACKEQRVVVFPRTLANKRESFTIYQQVLRDVDKCPFQLTTVSGVFTVELDSSRKFPVKCFACPNDSTAACTNEVRPPQDEPMGEDCKWVLTNVCRFVKVKESNPTLECN